MVLRLVGSLFAIPLVVSGCFDPSILPGLDCSSGRTCPPGQYCSGTICDIDSGDTSKACDLLDLCCDELPEEDRQSCHDIANPSSSSTASSDSSSSSPDPAACVEEFCNLGQATDRCGIAARDYGCSSQ